MAKLFRHVKQLKHYNQVVYVWSYVKYTNMEGFSVSIIATYWLCDDCMVNNNSFDEWDIYRFHWSIL